MNSLNRKCRSLLLIVTLGLLSVHAPAQLPASTKNLIAELKKSLPAPTTTLNDLRPVGFAHYADQLEALLASGRYAEVEQTLTQLRTTLPADNEKASDLIEQLLTSVRAQLADAAAKQEAAYTAIEKDFVAKFTAKAPAADFDALLKRLAALPPVVAFSNPNTQKIELLRNFITRWQDYLLQSARGNTEQALQSLNELVQQSSRLPIIPRSQLSNLLNEASSRVSTRNEAAEARLAAAQKQLLTLTDSARSAADLDALLVELAKPLQLDGVMVRGNNYINQWESLRRFATRWQDYLSQTEAGKSENAQNTLRELVNGNTYDAVYPRSRILARLNGITVPLPAAPTTKPLEPLLAPAEVTIDKLNLLFTQVQLRQSSNAPLPAGLEDLPVELGNLRSALAVLSSGAPGTVITDARNVSRSNGRIGGYAEVFAAIKVEILLRAFTQYLDAPATMPPARGESFDAYSKRLLEHGQKQKDWPLVYRVLIARQNLAPGTSGHGPDVIAYKIFIAGMQQESAGLWSMAVQSYYNALNAASLLLPVAEIAERLKHLKAEHPEEYAMTPYTLFLGDSNFPSGQPYPANDYGPTNGRPIPAPPGPAKPTPPPSSTGTPSAK